MYYTESEVLEQVVNFIPSEEYLLANKKTDDMLRHSEDKNWARLIMDKRPTEPQEVYDWRIANFRSPTRAYLSKIVQMLQAIPRANDFMLNYPAPAARIGTVSSFKQYCEYEWPEYGNVWNWIQEVLIPTWVVGPNDVLVVKYQDEYGGYIGGDYPKPEACIYQTVDALVVQKNMVLLRTKEKFKHMDNVLSTIFLLVDTESYRYFTTDSSGKTYIELVDRRIFHGLDECPARRTGGNVVQNGEAGPYASRVYESKVAGVVPMWDVSLADWSDLQGAYKQAIYPEKFQHVSDVCGTCNGQKTIVTMATDKAGNTVQRPRKCTACHGHGFVASPMNTHIIRPPKNGEAPLSGPVAGFIEKETETTKMLEKRVDSLIYKGLAAVNMEFLTLAPMNQSGVAKEYDRENLNAFLYSCANHLIRSILEPMFRYAAALRYKGILGSVSAAKMQAPSISVPTKFDVISISALIDKRKALKEAGASAVLLKAIDTQITGRELSSNPEEMRVVLNSIELNPLPPYSIDELLALQMAGVITTDDIRLSLNIQTYVREAMAKDVNFNSKTIAEKSVAIRQLIPADDDEEAPILQLENES